MVRNSILFSLLAFCVAMAQPVKVSVKTDSTRYLIGDYIGFSISLQHTAGITVVFPPIKDSLGKVELIGVDKIDSAVTPDGGRKIDVKLILTSFDSGNVVIPSFYIPYRSADGKTIDCVRTDSILLTVNRVAVDTASEIKDIKEPIKEPFNYLILVYITLGLMIALAALWYVHRRITSRKKHESAVPEKILTPYELAIKQLNDLTEKKLWQAGKVKEYHTEITEIIRKYFEKTFLFQALEMTSGEIISNLRDRNLSIHIINTTEDFLANADMVKFAKFVPMPKVNEEMMSQAYSIVQEQNKLFVASVKTAETEERTLEKTAE